MNDTSQKGLVCPVAGDKDIIPMAASREPGKLQGASPVNDLGAGYFPDAVIKDAAPDGHAVELRVYLAGGQHKAQVLHLCQSLGCV
ncbi:unknown [Akkermansia sp. CAG:344]|jgi:hypothetical protein|nr:unknown [Akkermansia sp. CAG:344]